MRAGMGRNEKDKHDMKTTTQHTPVNSQTTLTAQPDGEQFVIVDGNGNFFARCYSSSDAALIVSIPELLGSLRALVTGDGQTLNTRLIDRAFSILSKATGGAK